MSRPKHLQNQQSTQEEAMNSTGYDTFLNDSFYTYEYENYEPTLYIPAAHICTYSVLLYVGLCTNLWMLWSLYKTWETGSRGHFYLLALCVAEFVAVILYSLTHIFTLVAVSLRASNLFCNIISCLRRFGFTLTHYILAAFNVDNVITLICQRSIKKLRAVFLVLAILITCAVSIPQIAVLGMPSKFAVCMPTIGPFEDVGKYPLTLIAIVGVTFFAVIFFGGPTLCLWCAKKDAITHKEVSEEGVDAGIKNIGREIGMAVGFDALLLLCWIPITLFFVFPISRAGFFVATSLSVTNSCLNPIVYAIVNHVWKRRSNVSPPL